MPVNPAYPGVYVQEVPSGVRTIVGVSTSITLFVGRTRSGPMNQPVPLTNFSDFSRTFSDDNTQSDVARYVKLFFLNGGTDCYVMRIARNAVSASVALQNDAGTPTLGLSAKHPGVLGNSIRVAVRYNGLSPESTFNLEIFRWVVDSRGQRTRAEREEWNNLTMDPASPSFAPVFLTQKSALVNATDLGVAPQNGCSISGRPVPTEPADVASFITAWSARLGSTVGAKNHFQISVDGNPFADVDLSPINIAGLPNATLPDLKTALAAAILQRIAIGLSNAGILIPAPAVDVEFRNGPAAVAAGGETTLLKISSRTGKDVRILSASNPAQDVAADLMLGEANGGIEAGAHSARRPAPTGISFKAADIDALTAFGGLLQSDLKSITLDQVDANGGIAQAQVTFDLNVPPNATRRVWVDSTGGPRGLREKLGMIRDAINTFQPAGGAKFFWKAELWGLRLALWNTAAEDSMLAPLSTGTTNLTTHFANNVRYYSLGPDGTAGLQAPGPSGSDGVEPQAAQYQAAYDIAESAIDLFNILVLPPDRGANATPLTQLWNDASVFCQKERAFLIMDPPDAWTTSQEASIGVDGLRVGLVKDYSAVYFPRLNIVENGRQVAVGPAGAIAGLYARTDANRGVWKAAAGTEAALFSVSGVDVPLSDPQNGQINPVGVNAIRVFPDGIVSWGARTMAGADVFASEYKYIPIRRLALLIEESLYRGLKWAVFEPNDEPLWAQIRLNVGAFMHNLFRQGAFQGQKPSEAYFVKCDAETTTQNDRNLGMVNIWVGFAPLKPAEFVVLYLQQIAGKIET